MSIQELYTNIKRHLSNPDTVTVGIVLVVGIASFWLGRFSIENNSISSLLEANEENREQIQAMPPLSPDVVSATALTSGKTQEEPKTSESLEGGYVASKSGTKYHLPWCGSAKQIKEENKIWFKTKEAAEAAGYSPAANCKGI